MLESGKLCCTLQKFSLEVMQGSMTLTPTFPVDFPPNLYKLNTHYPHLPLHHIPSPHLPYSFFVILPIIFNGLSPPLHGQKYSLFHIMFYLDFQVCYVSSGGQPWATCNPPSPWPPDLIAFICHPPTHPSLPCHPTPNATPPPMPPILPCEVIAKHKVNAHDL
jgi:hypothetical protein